MIKTPSCASPLHVTPLVISGVLKEHPHPAVFRTVNWFPEFGGMNPKYDPATPCEHTSSVSIMSVVLLSLVLLY